MDFSKVVAVVGWRDGSYNDGEAGCGWAVRCCLDIDLIREPISDWPLFARVSYALPARSAMEAELMGSQSLACICRRFLCGELEEILDGLCT